MNINPLFQVGLDVLNRTCLVLGGGREAEEKTDRLLDAGARVVLLATDLTPALAEWANTERICHYARPLQRVTSTRYFWW